MEIRTFVPAQPEGLVSLWRDCGLVHPANDPDHDIDPKVADSPWGLLVAADRTAADDGPDVIAAPCWSGTKAEGRARAPAGHRVRRRLVLDVALDLAVPRAPTD